MEWNDPDADSRDGYLIPRVPPDDASDIRNADPLVLGPYMYLDYCKKEHRKPQNGLGAGDAVLGFTVRQRAVVIDTVFVIGVTLRWPTSGGGAPNWPTPGPLAERVHFHPHARREHPDMHLLPDLSYRSCRDDEVDGPVGYSWVPCVKSLPRGPFTLHPTGRAHRLLQRAYGKTVIEDCARNARVVGPPCSPRCGLAPPQLSWRKCALRAARPPCTCSILKLLEALRDEAVEKEFEIAAELRPLS
jgi:hypothetical protein